MSYTTFRLKLALQHSFYSVISPEGCAAILWKTAEKRKHAAEALKLTAQDLMKLGVIDAIVPEPLGGAHRDYDTMAETLKVKIQESLQEVIQLAPKRLVDQRIEKFARMGYVVE